MDRRTAETVHISPRVIFRGKADCPSEAQRRENFSSLTTLQQKAKQSGIMQLEKVTLARQDYICESSVKASSVHYPHCHSWVLSTGDGYAQKAQLELVEQMFVRKEN